MDKATSFYLVDWGFESLSGCVKTYKRGSGKFVLTVIFKEKNGETSKYINRFKTKTQRDEQHRLARHDQIEDSTMISITISEL